MSQQSIERIEQNGPAQPDGDRYTFGDGQVAADRLALLAAT